MVLQFDSFMLRRDLRMLLSHYRDKYPSLTEREVNSQFPEASNMIIKLDKVCESNGMEKRE